MGIIITSIAFTNKTRKIVHWKILAKESTTLEQLKDGVIHWLGNKMTAFTYQIIY